MAVEVLVAVSLDGSKFLMISYSAEFSALAEDESFFLDEFLLSISETSVNCGFKGATGGENAGKVGFEKGKDAGENLSYGAADDELVGGIFGDDVGEAEVEAGGDVFHDLFVTEGGDFVGVVRFSDGGGGGDIFPFFGLAFEGVELVAGFEGGGFGEEDAVSREAATDAGGEGQINREARIFLGFVKSAKAGVVLEEDRTTEQIFYRFFEVKFFPRTITEMD